MRSWFYMSKRYLCQHLLFWSYQQSFLYLTQYTKGFATNSFSTYRLLLEAYFLDLSSFWSLTPSSLKLGKLPERRGITTPFGDIKVVRIFFFRWNFWVFLHFRRKWARPVSCYAVFKGCLLPSTPPGCICSFTFFLTQNLLEDLTKKSGLFPFWQSTLAC